MPLLLFDAVARAPLNSHTWWVLSDHHPVSPGDPVGAATSAGSLSGKRGAARCREGETQLPFAEATGRLSALA